MLSPWPGVCQTSSVPPVSLTGTLRRKNQILDSYRSRHAVPVPQIKRLQLRCLQGRGVAVVTAAAGFAVGVSHSRRSCQSQRSSGWPQQIRDHRRTVIALATDSNEEQEAVSSGAGSGTSDAARVALVAQRLTAAEGTLRRWGYIAEVVYTWLGLISLSVASFSAYSQGGLRAFRSTSMGLGLTAVGLSVICALIGWFQARTCRTLGRRCGLAASALEPGGPTPPASQLMTMMPSLSAIETGLRARQRTAWLGSLFAIVGLQSMVGLMVAKVLATSGGLASSPGINLDIFTLLAVGNAALSHVIGGGAAAIQQGALPAPSTSDDPFQGWGRQ
mmetsp:Transcript_71433/g.128566  ORF Transcript_71433/g.128566 Transcript_71433/m.128566 type:complete len:332 (-) Transcript_71433:63-1058(-)